MTTVYLNTRVTNNTCYLLVENGLAGDCIQELGKSWCLAFDPNGKKHLFYVEKASHVRSFNGRSSIKLTVSFSKNEAKNKPFSHIEEGIKSNICTRIAEYLPAVYIYVQEDDLCKEATRIIQDQLIDWCIDHVVIMMSGHGDVVTQFADSEDGVFIFNPKNIRTLPIVHIKYDWELTDAFLLQVNK